MDPCKIFMQTLPKSKDFNPIWVVSWLVGPEIIFEASLRHQDSGRQTIFFFFNLSITTFKLGQHLLVGVIKGI